VAGGQAGKPSEFVLNPGTDRERNLGNVDVVYLEPGDVVRITSCGGGGWGDPYRRDPARVLADVRNGFVSAEAAAADYGVVIRDGEVDPEATARLRASRPARADGEGFFEFGPERAAYEAVWTRQMYDTLTELLWGVPVTWRGFFKGKVFTAVDEISKTRQPTPGDLRAVFSRLKATFFGGD
jgi:N-methylhydantoinase B